MRNDESTNSYNIFLVTNCDDPETAKLINTGIAEIMMQENINRQRAILRLMVYGLLQLCNGDKTDPEVVQMINDHRLYGYVKAQFEADIKRQNLIQSVGAERAYYLVAKEDPAAADRMLERQEQMDSMISHTTLASDAEGQETRRLWLLRLFADMQSRTANAVKDLVIQDFGTQDIDREWARTRTAASRIGLSTGSKKGVWKMTDKIRRDNIEDLINLGVYAEYEAKEVLAQAATILSNREKETEND